MTSPTYFHSDQGKGVVKSVSSGGNGGSVQQDIIKLKNSFLLDNY